jgi:uncharacterized membrane protein
VRRVVAALALCRAFGGMRLLGGVASPSCRCVMSAREHRRSKEKVSSLASVSVSIDRYLYMLSRMLRTEVTDS